MRSRRAGGVATTPVGANTWSAPVRSVKASQCALSRTLIETA